MNELGRNIRRCRRRKGMKQAELAAKLGTSGMIISNYERGIYNPSMDRITAIADALNVEIDELIGDDAPSTAELFAVLQRVHPDDLQKMIESLSEALRAIQPEWRTDLPTTSSYYIVTMVDSYNHYTVSMAYFNKNTGDWMLPQIFTDVKKYQVTAWTQTPAPYKGK